MGIVPTVRDDVLESPSAHIYVPSGRHYRSGMTLHVRTAPGAEAAMLEFVRQTIRRVDARVPIVSLRTLTNHRDSSVSLWAVSLLAQLFAAFGAIALVLATVGVYGLRAYLVAQRTREMGIRIALGATRKEIITQLLGESAAMTAAALACRERARAGVDSGSARLRDALRGQPDRPVRVHDRAPRARRSHCGRLVPPGAPRSRHRSGDNSAI